MRKRILLSIVVIPLLAAVICAPFLEAILYFLFLLLLSVLVGYEVHGLTGSILARRVPGFDEGAFSRLRVVFILTPAILLLSSLAIQLVLLPSRIILYGGMILGGGILTAGLLGGGHRLRIAAAVLVNLLCAGAIPLLMYRIRVGDSGVILSFFLFAVPWVSDAAAYLIGGRYGKRRGILKVSPNKSLEGYAGSVPCVLLAACGFALVFPGRFPFSLAGTLVLGILMSLSAPLGDLVESSAKRRAGVKDSSRLIPGMGGVLDVFDSVLLSVPVLYLYGRILGRV
jgi:CDP-diglyceride synthetase